MPSPNSIDDIIEIYKKDVDVTLLDECLKLTVEQRLQRVENALADLEELRAAVARAGR